MSNQTRMLTPMSIAAALVALLCTASAAHAVTYIVTQLTNGLSGRARDISPNGMVCGVDLGHAFVWRPSSPNAVTGTA
jgi:archaellum component FlaG (FlaF/FlaG flagellin family)